MGQQSEELRAALEGAMEKRSAAQILRPILPEIEAALQQGAKYVEIRRVLKAQGLGEISEHNFRMALYRLRKELSKEAPAGEGNPEKARSPVAGAVSEPNRSQSSGALNPIDQAQGQRMPIIPEDKTTKFEWSKHRDAPIRW